MILIANICVHFQLLFGGWLITSAEKQNIQIESLKLGRDRRLVIPAVFELSVTNKKKESSQTENKPTKETEGRIVFFVINLSILALRLGRGGGGWLCLSV